MKTFKIILILITVLIGLIGLAGVFFLSIDALRSLLLLYTLLLVLSISANFILAGSRKIKLQRVKK